MKKCLLRKIQGALSASELKVKAASGDLSATEEARFDAETVFVEFGYMKDPAFLEEKAYKLMRAHTNRTITKVCLLSESKLAKAAVWK